MEKKINSINSWKARNKQRDKVYIYVRFGKLTVFEVYLDLSTKEFRVMILNFGYERK